MIIRTEHLKVEDIKNSILLANSGLEMNELYVDFINTIECPALYGVFSISFNDILSELFESDLTFVRLSTIYDNGFIDTEYELTLKDKERKLENYPVGFYKTEQLMINRIVEIVNSMDLVTVYEGFSKELYLRFLKAVEDYKLYAETKKEKPSKEGLVIHCLVYLFNEKSVDIEIGMEKKQ